MKNSAKIRLSALALASLVSVSFSTCSEAAPATPTGLIPGSAVGSSTVTVTNGIVRLQWNSVTSATYYHIQLQNLSSNTYSYFNPTITRQDVSVQKNVYYKWLVQACNNLSGCSAPSQTYTFLTK